MPLLIIVHWALVMGPSQTSQGLIVEDVEASQANNLSNSETFNMIIGRTGLF